MEWFIHAPGGEGMEDRNPGGFLQGNSRELLNTIAPQAVRVVDCIQNNAHFNQAE